MKFSGLAMTQVRERASPRAVDVARKEYIMVSQFGFKKILSKDTATVMNLAAEAAEQGVVLQLCAASSG
jgi:hypothetical protein